MNMEGTDPKNLIVNYIPTPVTDAELRQLFEQFGEVESARIIVDRINNHPKGYGFVKFKTEEAAIEAIQKMNGFEIHNKRLKVTPARGPQSAQINNYTEKVQKMSQGPPQPPQPVSSGPMSQGAPAPPPPPPPPPPQSSSAPVVDTNTGMATIQVPIQFLQLLQQQQAYSQPQMAPQQTIYVPMQVAAPMSMLSSGGLGGFTPFPLHSSQDPLMSSSFQLNVSPYASFADSQQQQQQQQSPQQNGPM